jgi:hypothetical protein
MWGWRVQEGFEDRFFERRSGVVCMSIAGKRRSEGNGEARGEV